MIATHASSSAAPALTGTTLYATLADSLQALIGTGTLRPGHRVPSVRRMALQRDVSISTVLQAYTLLESRGFLEARPQSGYYVRPRLPSQAPEPRMARPMAAPRFVGVNDLTAAVFTYAADPNFIPFGAACPHHSLFPNKNSPASSAPSAATTRHSSAATRCTRPTSLLAREISRRYLQAGMPLAHDELVVTVGCAEALNLCLRAVTKPGAHGRRRNALLLRHPRDHPEPRPPCPRNPHQPPATASASTLLREALVQHDVKALFVIPSFQNPLGTSMPDAKKEKLYQLLVEFDLPAIEDDIYGDLHFDERRPSPSRLSDTDGRILLCSSFGKTLAPPSASAGARPAATSNASAASNSPTPSAPRSSSKKPSPISSATAATITTSARFAALTKTSSTSSRRPSFAISPRAPASAGRAEASCCGASCRPASTPFDSTATPSNTTSAPPPARSSL